VTQTRDRRELGDDMDNAHDDGSEERDRGVHRPALSQDCWTRRHVLGQNAHVRYLTIVRHAKAEKAAPGQSDFERTLSDRGRRQCEQLKKWASDAGELGLYGPAIALVSSAVRTRETFELALAGTPLVSDVVFSELIYNGRRDVSGEDLLLDIAAIDPVTTSLLVVGHNPTVLELVWTLVKKLPVSLRDGFPTGGAYVLSIPDGQQIGLSHYDFVSAYVPG